MMNKNILRGFTLIETLIYIALLAFLLTGAVASSYQLMQSASQVDSKNIGNEEAAFVLQKINWALSGAFSVTLPTTYGSTLSVTKYDGTTVDMRLNNGQIEMRENGAAYVPITTNNVQVASLSYHTILPANGAPAGVEATTTINGVSYYTERYLPK